MSMWSKKEEHPGAAPGQRAAGAGARTSSRNQEGDRTSVDYPVSERPIRIRAIPRPSVSQ